MSSNYPRLAEKFGKRYSWKVMLNPRINIHERSHVKVGDVCAESRDSYHKQWKKVLRKRAKPTRQLPYESQINGIRMQSPGASLIEPKTCLVSQRVATSLSKVRTPQLSELIDVGDIVGSGIEGVVRPGVRKPNRENSCWQELSEKFSNKLLAVKTVERKHEGGIYSSAGNCREVNVMTDICQVQHPNITPYLYTFESPVRFHIVTEFNKGGDLFSYLQDNNFTCIEEEDAARVLMQLFCAIQYVHELGYVHLDLKLENVMRRNKGPSIDEGGVSVIDFGHASKVPVQNYKKLLRPVGSPSYAAPEIVLEKKYSVKSDAWSLGVIMYILLQGFLPYPHLQQKKWREFSINDYGNFDKKQEENDPFFYDGDWQNISPEAKDLCQKLLNVNSDERMSVADALAHKWFVNQGVHMVRNENNQPILRQGLKRSQSISETVLSWM